ncbi:MAG: hypothetical protein PHT62_14195 [Desulfotomaculaceae bacterium]|nr:hypothetical protein [Desulfotomaculaceae bacterium]
MSIPETSLVTQQGGLAQFEGTVQDMAIKLNEMKAKISLVNDFFKDIMEKDTDYGVIPGTPKPSLYQPGADKLCSLYNLSKRIVHKDENKNYETGHYDVTVRVQLVHRGSNIVVGELEGSCSTMESKYRYRWGYERDIPKGIDKDTLLSKEYPSRNGGTYLKYRIENEDLFSQWNTVLKMAIKRAYVGCTLSSTGLSGLFTQGEEELEEWINGEEPGQGGNGGQQQQRQEQGQSRSQGQGQQSRNGNSGNGNRGTSSRPASEKQIGALFAIGKKHNLTSDDVKAIVQSKASQDINNLTAAEASNMIEFMGKATTDDLLDLLGFPGDADFDGGAQ